MLVGKIDLEIATGIKLKLDQPSGRVGRVDGKVDHLALAGYLQGAFQPGRSLLGGHGKWSIQLEFNPGP